jgi:hypothetical protein
VKILVSLLLTAWFATDPGAAVKPPLETTAGELLANFTAGRFEAASKDFNDTMRATVPPSTLVDLKHQFDAQLGAFGSVTEVRQRREDGFRVVELISRCEKSLLLVRVVFDASDRVGAVFFDPIIPPPVDPVLQAVALELLADITASRFDVAGKHFDAALRAQLPPSALAKLNKQMAEEFGAFRSVTEVRQRTEQGLRIIDLNTAYDDSPDAVGVEFDAEGRVAGEHIRPVPKP